MEKTGLLVLTNPSKISRILPAVKEHVKKTLYVQLTPQRQLLPPWALNGEHSLKPSHFRKIVVGIYSQTASVTTDLDVRVLLACLKNPYQNHIDTRKTVDIVIFDNNFSSDEVTKFMDHCLPNKASSCQVVTINANPEEEHENEKIYADSIKELSEIVQPVESTIQIYDNVVLGGTFDHLHSGHKILLCEALLHCSKKLTVGVTDTEMLRSKKLWELIEPCAKRISNVHNFLCDVDSSLQYEIVPISDPFGPTKSDPDLQLLVVSSETLRGGQRVNDLRRDNGLPVLDVLCIDLLESVAVRNIAEEAKVSSSNYRIELLGERLRTPQPCPGIPDKPYMIGLTGSIASGKSSVAKRLEGLGAGVIDCDGLAHGLYKKGEQCYQQIVEAFGEMVLDGQKEVDRRVLGSIVFSDKEQLMRLNHILWPAILEKAKEEAQQLQARGSVVVVMDAAVLLQAGWDRHCHETWVCIIPPDEAVRRLQSRNNLSEEAARCRITTLPTNEEMVHRAHLVLCTLWEPDFTQQQVEKAWRNLLTFLEANNKL